MKNLIFANVHERGLEPQLRVTESFNCDPLHSIECSDECRTTIRINKVVTCMYSKGDNFGLLGNCYCIGYREHHSVAIWHHSYCHVGGSIVSIWNRDCIGES